MSEELQRSAELIERLLGDPDLRRRFRSDPTSVLKAHGLLELAAGLGGGKKSLMTLELRESRSSLAGVLVAAATEGVDFGHLAEHAAPGIERQLSQDFEQLVHGSPKRPAHHAPAPAKPQLGSGGSIPPLAQNSQPSVPAGQAPQPVTAPGSAAAPLPSTPTTGNPSPGTAGGQAAAPGPQASGRQPVTGQAPTGGRVAAGSAALGPVGHRELRSLGHRHGGNGDHIGGLPGPHPDMLSYPGDTATPQQLAAWMGAHAQQAGLPPELPLMAALTESGLKNLSYGDRDSVGFFQMRSGTWNRGAYAGFSSNPNLQIKWFIDHALAVKQQDPAITQDPSTWGEWVANVEQPAAEFRYRYQLQLNTAQDLLKGIDLAATQQAAPPAAPVVPVGQEALGVARKYLGTPYHWGGSTPATGFDCSGLVQYSFAQEGIQLPRVAAQQFEVGIPVAREHLRPGDAVFFADPGGYVHHVGIYIGHDEFISAPHTGENVNISSLSNPYFASQYAGARRYTAQALSNPGTYARTLPTVSH